MNTGPDFWRLVLMAVGIVLVWGAINYKLRGRYFAHARRQQALRATQRAQARLDAKRDRMGGPHNA